MLIGAIEAGGTKFVLGLGNEHGEILDKVSIPTTTPEETIPKVIEFFKNKNIEAIGLGCFGPIDPNPLSSLYGYITTTPKLKWTNYNIVGELKKHFNIPISFDTDVNGAALAEIKWGAAKGLNNVAYITIGTGIGAGAVTNGKMVHGLLHPEMGHISIKKHPLDSFDGICPFHRDCLEGLASGPSIEARWSISGKNLPENHFGWEIEAYYIAQLIINLILIQSPEKIILGGGVMSQEFILPIIHKQVKHLLNGYINKKEVNENIENYIITSKLKENIGLCGALALALNK